MVWSPRAVSIPAYVLIALWFLQQLFNGIASQGGSASFTGGIAFWAHVGGFGTGVVLVWLLKDQASVDRQRAAQEAPQPAPRRAVGATTPRTPRARDTKRRGPF